MSRQQLEGNVAGALAQLKAEEARLQELYRSLPIQPEPVRKSFLRSLADFQLRAVAVERMLDQLENLSPAPAAA